MPLPVQSIDPTAVALGEADNRLRCAPNHPVWLVHHATEWEIAEVDGETVWLPTLSPRVLREGVNGVRTLSRGEDPGSKYSELREIVRAGGGILLDPADKRFRVTDPEHLPEGAEAGSYLRATPTASGGHRFHFVWDTLSQPAPGNADPVVSRDIEAMNRWRLHLVTSGALDAPHPQVLSAIVARWSMRLTATESAAARDPDAEARKFRVSRAMKRLDAYRSAIPPQDFANREPEAAAPATTKPARKGKPAEVAA